MRKEDVMLLRLLLLLSIVSISAAIAGDEGVGIDPFGIRNAIASDEGAGLDPHGLSAGITTCDGAGLDPHGGCQQNSLA
jgi:hypothetical protein